jgi:hypothetical protein
MGKGSLLMAAEATEPETQNRANCGVSPVLIFGVYRCDTITKSETAVTTKVKIICAI